MIDCTCGYHIDEPINTQLLDCPKCGAFLLIPSRSDWEMLHKEWENLK